jgi:polyhydroxyalkanoate synthesis repressor PhaR
VPTLQVSEGALFRGGASRAFLGGKMKETLKEMKIIKRYQNRKLYDTHESSYVTLDEIAKMIKNGEDLRVIDNKTKNDITASTLTQLLYESEKKAKTQPSVELLKEIIRHGDGSFSGYIQAKVSSELARFDQDIESAPSSGGNAISASNGAERPPVLNQ